MKCLVTGATGFIAGNLIPILRDQGHEVKTLGREQTDIFLKQEQFDWIFHLAAELYDKNEMFESNVIYTHGFLCLSQKLNFKSFIHVGTHCEYGPRTIPITDREKLSAIEWYGATKAAGSTLARAFAIEKNLPITIARLFNVYGPGEAPRRFVPTLLRNIAEGKQSTVYAGSHDFIYVKDVCTALIKIAEKPSVGDEVNIGTGIMNSNEDFVLELQKVLGKKIDYKVESGFIRPWDSSKSVCDVEHAWSKYGIMHHYSIEEGLRDYL
jgi:nucleoside-diphosphate-sugar epimerase